MGRATNAGLARQWRERIQRWQGATGTVREFCRREAVSPASFYQWRRRLKAAATDTVTKRRRPRQAVREAFAPGFVQLPPLAWPATSDVQITLPGGAVVSLSSRASTERVAAVVRAAMLAPGSETGPC